MVIHERKKKVLLVSPNFDGKSSWMRCAVQTAKNLVSAGFDVVVLTTNTENQSCCAFEGGIQIYRVNSFLLPDPLNLSVPNFFVFWKMLKKLKADVVILNKTWFFTSLIASIYYRIRGVKYFVQLDTVVGKVWFGTCVWMNVLMWVYARTFNRFVLNGAKSCIVYHQGLARVMDEWHLSYDVVSQGVSCDSFANAKACKEVLGFKDGRVCFLFVGRLDDIKRWQKYKEITKKVWARYPGKVCFVWVLGNKHLEKIDVLREEMRPYNTKVFSFRSDVAEVMKACDCLVLPSKCEGMPDVIMEAQSSGLCCVASNVGGIPYLIKHGSNGFLFNALNDLKLQMICLVNDPGLIKECGKNAQQSIKKHDNSEVIKKLKEILNQ